MDLIKCPVCGREIHSKAPAFICNSPLSEGRKYKLFYDLVIREESRLKNIDSANEYRLCKALAACYELQDYLANRLAEYNVD